MTDTDCGFYGGLATMSWHPGEACLADEDVPQAAERYSEFVAAYGFEHLPITHLHSLRAGGYDMAHRDPFDRMLAAQSELERLPLVT